MSRATLEVPAFAKLNLGLEVLGPRSDGYHELRTLFQTIELHDTVRVALVGGRDIEVACDHGLVPDDATNLAHRAARELRRRSGRKHGVRIEIRKRIPVAAGLGGGSSDAAAVLRALDHLWRLRLGRLGLEPLARRLGADVAFFLQGGTALGLGRGDETYALAEQVKAHVVVADPGRPVATAGVYGRVDRRLTPRENSLTIYRFISSDFRGAGRFGLLRNDLEEAALEEAPDLAESARQMRDILVEEGAVLAQMSGSGSAFFGLFETKAGAARAKGALERRGFRAHLTRTLTSSQYRERWNRALGLRAGASGSGL
jgi:4-diphosphocytidyl-2-C-methyl-D-erythritol kinase